MLNNNNSECKINCITDGFCCLGSSYRIYPHCKLWTLKSYLALCFICFNFLFWPTRRLYFAALNPIHAIDYLIEPYFFVAFATLITSHKLDYLIKCSCFWLRWFEYVMAFTLNTISYVSGNLDKRFSHPTCPRCWPGLVMSYRTSKAPILAVSKRIGKVLSTRYVTYPIQPSYPWPQTKYWAKSSWKNGMK